MEKHQKHKPKGTNNHGCSDSHMPFLYGRYKLPVQRLAHFLPHHILLQLFLPVLHHRNIRQILRLVQQHTQLEQCISTVEEIGPVCRAMDRPRLLNLNKQDTKRILKLVTHYRRFDTQNRVNILDVLEIPIESQLLQYFAHLLIIDFRCQVLDTLLLDTSANSLYHMRRDLRRLLRLKLRQDFLEMVQAHIRIVGHLVRRFLYIGFSLSTMYWT